MYLNFEINHLLANDIFPVIPLCSDPRGHYCCLNLILKSSDLWYSLVVRQYYYINRHPNNGHPYLPRRGICMSPNFGTKKPKSQTIYHTDNILRLFWPLSLSLSLSSAFLYSASNFQIKIKIPTQVYLQIPKILR